MVFWGPTGSSSCPAFRWAAVRSPSCLAWPELGSCISLPRSREGSQQQRSMSNPRRIGIDRNHKTGTSRPKGWDVPRTACASAPLLGPQIVGFPILQPAESTAQRLNQPWTAIGRIMIANSLEAPFCRDKPSVYTDGLSGTSSQPMASGLGVRPPAETSRL